MKTAPLIVLLLLGALALYVVLDVQRRRAPAAAKAPNAATVNGYTANLDATTKQVDALSSAVVALSKAGGKTAGGSIGAAIGTSVSSGETQIAKGLGAPGLTEQQISDLQHNSSLNGLAGGAPSGANVSEAVGGAAGSAPFGFLSGFLSGAAGSELLRKGGIADRLNLPKWNG